MPSPAHLRERSGQEVRALSETRIDKAIFAQPGRLIALGCAMMASGKRGQAVTLMERALAQRPGDRMLRRAAELVLSHKVPGFHRAMLADEGRHRAYRRAIEGAELAGKTVLDIGTGSGLLAMMAARAGAARVYACEADEALAATARAIVAANGLSARVKILAVHSSTLDAERDLEGGADFILSEIFSHDLIGEGALPALSHALSALARPGARMLPAGASIRVALADYRGRRGAPIGSVEGFDLSLFERHAARAFAVAVDSRHLVLRSPAHDLFRFDFQNQRAFPEARAAVRAVAAGGPVNGIVQWIRLQLDAAVVYENAPAAGEDSHWTAIFHPFEREIDPRAGAEVEIQGWHDERRLLVWPDS